MCFTSDEVEAHSVIVGLKCCQSEGKHYNVSGRLDIISLQVFQPKRDKSANSAAFLADE